MEVILVMFTFIFDSKGMDNVLSIRYVNVGDIMFNWQATTTAKFVFL